MKEQMFLFQIIKDENKRIRLRLLPNQMLNNNTIDENKNVRCSYKIKKAYPIGTILCSNELKENENYYVIPNDNLFLASSYNNFSRSSY